MNARKPKIMRQFMVKATSFNLCSLNLLSPLAEVALFILYHHTMVECPREPQPPSSNFMSTNCHNAISKTILMHQIVTKKEVNSIRDNICFRFKSIKIM